MRKSWNTIPALIALAAVGSAGLLVAAARAQGTPPRRPPVIGVYVPGSMGIPQPEPRIALSVQQRSLGRVLSEIFKQTPYDYRVLADSGTALFSVDARGEPLTAVLQKVFSQDKRPDPLVFYFQSAGRGGEFIIDREFIEMRNQDGEPWVSLVNARVTKVLPDLFKAMKVEGRVEPDVPPVVIKSLQFRPNSWNQVLPVVMLEAYKLEPGLTYSMDGNAFVVHLHKTPVVPLSTAGAAAVRRVKVTAVNMPLRDVLTELFKDSKWKYQVADKVPDTKVTYSATAEPELSALVNVLRLAGGQGQQVTYREGKGILYIEPGPLPGEAVVSSKNPLVGVKLFTLDVRLLAIKEIADSIARQTGVTIEVLPSIPNVQIPFKIENATAEEALKALVLAARASLPNLQYRSKGQGFVLELGTKQ